ncbi:MAG: response regulator [Pseudomonadota bacterium]
MAKIAVLAIDDDDVQHMLLSRLLRDGSDGYAYELECCHTLESAFYRLDSGRSISVVLLDLGLSGSQGVETVTRFGSRVKDYPLIILTGNSDQDVARRALHMGAEDYLDKTDLTDAILQRAIRYSLERFNLKRDLETARYEREIAFTEEIGSDTDSPVASHLCGQRNLRLAAPSTFTQLVGAYAEAVGDAIEQRAFHVDHRLSDRLQSMADTLGRLMAKPRDVVDIHTEALRMHGDGGGGAPAKMRARVEESRYLLLELVGNLCSYYRRQSVGFGSSESNDKRSESR